MIAQTISLDLVRHALRQLARDHSPSRSPLADLQCVRRLVRDAGFDASREAREFELGRLLLDIVGQELERLREQAGLSRNGPPPRDLRLWPIPARIRADFERDNPELEAFSAVYHLYCRPDLNLGLQDLIRIAPGTCRRTLQRRLQRGLLAITERLHGLERGARRAEPARMALMDSLPWSPAAAPAALALRETAERAP